MTEKGTFHGGCHCGRVRYEVRLETGPVIDCNCSFCTKRGALWSYVEPDAFKLVSGADDLTDYQFNTRANHHLFCKACGVGSFSRGRGEDGTEGIGINVRCLDSVDLATLERVAYDGRQR